MIDLVSVLVGIICGGGSGFIIGSFTNLQKIRQLRDDVFVRDKLLEAAQNKLRVLTERDDLGRFTGGKK